MNDPKLFERIKARTAIEPSGCWRWTGSLHSSSRYPSAHYGMMSYGGGGPRATHRLMWTAVHGPIPKGLCVCHTCDLPACVNPAHLWLGTHAQNMADMNRKGRNTWANKSECKNGHPLNEANTGRNRRQRFCLICAREATRRYAARKALRA